MTTQEASGRVPHAEKITVYLTPDELARLDTARMQIRHEHGVRVDRGRIVRDALALVLTEFEFHGEASRIVQRVREIR